MKMTLKRFASSILCALLVPFNMFSVFAASVGSNPDTGDNEFMKILPFIIVGVVVLIIVISIVGSKMKKNGKKK